MTLLPCIIPPPPPSFAKTFQNAYACGKDVSCEGKHSEQELLLSLLREAETLCEDERIMGLLPCVLDGYAWVLGGLWFFHMSDGDPVRARQLRTTFTAQMIWCRRKIKSFPNWLFTTLKCMRLM